MVKKVFSWQLGFVFVFAGDIATKIKQS